MRHLLAATLGFIVFVSLSVSVFAADRGAAPAAIENTLGMKFVLVPAGEFVMGSDESPDILSKVYPQYERRRVEELGGEAPERIACVSHNLSILASLKSVSASSANF